ncbi:MAG: GNAT family N-acetyltransferase [Myxococcaceae bacterium]|nr:GNAT family N-acetyltransferase [Myxococcaceae bacterium]
MDTPASALRIRDARPEDDVTVGELLVEAFVRTYAEKMPHVVVSDQRRRDLRAVAEKRAVARVWVAELRGEVIGTVALWPPGAPGSEAWLPRAADLRHLAVSPRHRGIGASQALLDTAEAHAWSLNADAICLHVRRGATGVARLYQSRGYVRAPEGDLDKLPEVFLEAYVLRRQY